ncbi:hypothetical protein [Herbaspirillum sp. ST 5-3]|uniref:hypothetical protein n=1 Tax=Herbaspirillum sp. ST 5-3 TaxID=2567936 RepID=UPI00200019CB|nr:hypothetical protein [Herbaspirillum sp. ST 5-3]
MGFPFVDETVTGTFGTATPAESLTEMTKSPVPPAVTVVGPVAVTAVPLTATVPVAETVPAVAVIVIVRLVRSPDVLSVAVALPLASVIADTPLSAPEFAEKVTGTAGMVLLLAFLTTAVTVTSVPLAPDEGNSGVLNSKETVVGVVVVEPLLPATTPGDPPPPPHEASMNAAKPVTPTRATFRKIFVIEPNFMFIPVFIS